ncbi:YqaA family protein [Jannaschia sp. LMIT008]|uniref:YqaA family protein n=1 Tax=Jannaschia maritima TaxID=3032585 RepID=UPI00281264B5|nr:YqaA family protein [Jannaschia sp. LMIT008]
MALAVLVRSGEHPVPLLLAVATVGNVGGSALNYALGRAAARLSGRRWFPVGPRALARAQGWYRRWGRWSLLLSWVPLIGDPLTVAAGVLRERLVWFLALVTVAKLARYAVVAALAAP